MNTKELIAKHPHLCSECESDSHVEKGWALILDELFTDIDELNIDGLKVVQFKQKLGGLRVYLNVPYDPDAQVQVLIKLAEEECAKACEFCGKPGRLHGKVRLYVACENCYKERSNGSR